MIYPTAKKDLLHSSRRCLQQPSRSRHWCHIHIPIACCPRPCSSRRTTESPRFDKRGSAFMDKTTATITKAKHRSEQNHWYPHIELNRNFGCAVLRQTMTA